MSNSSLPNSYSDVETKGTFPAVNTGFKDNKIRDTEEMYSVVNKRKNAQVNSTTQDDIVMYENDDLYEASVDKGQEQQDSKNQDKKINSGTEEETFMYENNDIYS